MLASEDRDSSWIRDQLFRYDRCPNFATNGVPRCALDPKFIQLETLSGALANSIELCGRSVGN
jgi:hypothetical protein